MADRTESRFCLCTYGLSGIGDITDSLWKKMKVKVVSDSLRPHGLSSPWNSPDQNTGVGSLSLLQGIFPTQGLNPSIPHCWQILYQLSHQSSPKILEWVVYPFSRGSSWPRNQTRVSCIAGGFFTSRAHKEAPEMRVIKSILVKSQIKLRVMLNELRT